MPVDQVKQFVELRAALQREKQELEERLKSLSEALEGISTIPGLAESPARMTASVPAPKPKRRRRRMSSEGRARIAAAARERWVRAKNAGKNRL